MSSNFLNIQKSKNFKQMKRAINLSLIAAFLFAISCSPKSEQKVNKDGPTNFVVVFIDDMGWADLGCYGSDLHETPHLDRLATQGVRFTDAYAASPVCTPPTAAAAGMGSVSGPMLRSERMISTAPLRVSSTAFATTRLSALSSPSIQPRSGSSGPASMPSSATIRTCRKAFASSTAAPAFTRTVRALSSRNRMPCVCSTVQAASMIKEGRMISLAAARFDTPPTIDGKLERTIGEIGGFGSPEVVGADGEVGQADEAGAADQPQATLGFCTQSESIGTFLEGFFEFGVFHVGQVGFEHERGR